VQASVDWSGGRDQEEKTSKKFEGAAVEDCVNPIKNGTKFFVLPKA